MLVLGIGGGGTWYWWTEKQKSEAVARLQKEVEGARSAQRRLRRASRSRSKKLGEALEKDKANLAHVRVRRRESPGLEALLYGTEVDRVDRALKAVGKDIKHGEPGARELVIGKAAVELSRLARRSSARRACESTLAEVRKPLDAYLAKNDDRQVGALAQGPRDARRRRAQGRRGACSRPPPTATTASSVAMIDRADLLVDDGQLDDGARALREGGRRRSKDHPLDGARPVARARRGVGRVERPGDRRAQRQARQVSSGRASARTATSRSRSRTWRSRTIRSAIESLEEGDRQQAAERAPVLGARRVGALRCAATWRDGAPRARQDRVVRQEAAEDDPTVQLVDAALLLASGLPEKALELAAKIEGMRPRLLRAYARPRSRQAQGRARPRPTELLKKAPRERRGADPPRAGAHDRRRPARSAPRPPTRSRSSRARPRASSAATRSASRGSPPATSRTRKTRSSGDHRRHRTTSPNPLAYRTRTALAEIALAAERHRRRRQAARRGAHRRTPGYFPTRVMQAQVVLRNNEPDRALDLLSRSSERARRGPADGPPRARRGADQRARADARRRRTQAKDDPDRAQDASSAPAAELVAGRRADRSEAAQGARPAGVRGRGRRRCARRRSAPAPAKKRGRSAGSSLAVADRARGVRRRRVASAKAPGSHRARCQP